MLPRARASGRGSCDVVMFAHGPPCGIPTTGDTIGCTRVREAVPVLCAPHRTDARGMLREHVVLVHPESLDKSHFTQLARDETQLATLREQARRSPDRYGRLLEYVESLARGDVRAPEIRLTRQPSRSPHAGQLRTTLEHLPTRDGAVNDPGPREEAVEKVRQRG